MRPALFVGVALIVAALFFMTLRAGSARVVTPEKRLSAVSSQLSASGSGSALKADRRQLTADSLFTTAKNGAHGDVIISGRWGIDFGRRHEAESNPEAPMAIAAGARGQLAIVDQVNRRILRYKDGKLVGTVDIGGDTVQDIAFARDGKMLVLDRLVDGNVQIYGADGKLQNEVALAGKGVTEGGGITGVFADDDGVYVERDHDTVVRIADATGQSDPNRPELAGRPSRDGSSLLSAAIADPQNGDIVVNATDRSGQPSWSAPLHLGIPIQHIITLDSDAAGLVYLAVDVGHETATAPFQIYDEHILILRLGSGGAPRGVLSIPPLPSADETFRPITVDDDGTVYVMTAGDAGLAVTRYVFP